MTKEIDLNGHTIMWSQAPEGESKDNEPHMNFVRVKEECLAKGFTPDRIKTLQYAVMLALEEYDSRGVPLSKDITGELFVEFCNLVKGSQTYLFDPMRKRGRPKEPLAHKAAICSAVMYIRAARRGEIDDPEPIDTVLDQYGGMEDGGLNKETVEGWLSDDQYSKDYEEGSDRLKWLMEFAGRYYIKNFLKAHRGKQS
jgi:hypothetical protein